MKSYLSCLVVAGSLAASKACFSQINASALSSVNSSSLPSSSSGSSILPAPSRTTAAPEDLSALKLAPGFLISIALYDEPDLDESLRVGPDGAVALPLAGPIQVNGLTTAETEKLIAQTYSSKKLLLHPQVTINIVEYTAPKITVLGEVERPGRVDLLAPKSLADVMATVGGETPLAGQRVIIHHANAAVNLDQTVIYHRSASSSKEISDVMVLPGDTITVPKAYVVYILGAVNHPGTYLMLDDGKLNVTEALALAGDAELHAHIGQMRILRTAQDGSISEIHVPYDRIMKGRAQPDVLQANDTLYVPVSKTKTILASSTNTISNVGGVLTSVAVH